MTDICEQADSTGQDMTEWDGTNRMGTGREIRLIMMIPLGEPATYYIYPRAFLFISFFWTVYVRMLSH